MKERLLTLLCFLVISLGIVSAQTKVTGLVVSADDGEPVIGASVLVKGTTIGTITGIDGKFHIANIPSSAKTLVVSYVGMKSQDVAIKSGLIRVELKNDSKVLDEVVVTAYGTSTKGTFTGSASVMKADKIEKRQVSNVSNALAGAVAGVQVLSDNGQPGTSAKIRIRGVGSINASSSPLYVVDGIPFDGDLSSISTNDIESMTVLKDAASTALYGARGANGIIMITTKQAKTGKAIVNFDAKIGGNSRAVKNYDVLTSPSEYVETAYKALYNAGLYNLKYDENKANRYANIYLPGEESGGLGYNVYTVPDGQSLIGIDGKLNPNATLGYNDGDYYYTPDNWADETFKNKLRQEYNLSVSGMGEKSSFYASFGYLKDGGLIDGSGFERFSGRIKSDYKVNNWLKVGANVNYVYSNSTSPGDQTNTASSGNAFYIANNMAPIYPMYVRDATSKEIMRNNGRKVYDYGDGESTNFSRSFMSIANPAGDLIYNKEEYLMDIINSNYFAEITPISGLKITAKYGLNIDNTRYNYLGNVYMGQSASYGGSASQEQTRTYGFDQQYVANYQFALDNMNHFDVTAGYDGYTYEKTNVYAQGQNLYDPEDFYINNTIDNKLGGGSKTTYSTEGFFGRLNYSYDDKYYANVSYRRDASSRFSPDNRWGNFWSASAAWIMTKEDFMKDLTWINMLKLKASYGEQGNDGIGNYYAWLDQYKVSGADGVFSDGVLTYKGNPDLTWETTTSYNVGFDFSLFQDKVSGSIEYFGRKSSDMLYNKPVAGSIGYTSIPMNVGSMTNSGLEIDANWNIYSSKDIKWNVNANATFLKNKINELHKDLKGQLIDGSRIYEEGKSMYRMYLVDYAGVDPETGLAQYWAKDKDGKAIKTSDYSLAQDYKVKTDDLLPTVYGGFGTSVEAYGFDASIQCSYQLGGTIYDSGYRYMMHGGTSSYAGQNWHTDIRKAWTPENKYTDVPRLDSNDKYANSSSTRFLTSSDYLSINNITLGYTIPKTLLSKMMIQKLRLFVTADNLALIAARKGLDPRQSFTSATTALYTPIRTISGGVSLTF